MKSTLTIFIVILFLSNLFGKEADIKNTKSIVITVSYKEATKDDTLALIICHPIYGLPLTKSSLLIKEFSSMDKEGNFGFNVHVEDSIGYYQIALVNSKKPRLFEKGIMQPLTSMLFYELGDDISININRKVDIPKFETYDPLLLFDFSFSGNGAKKLELLIKTDSIYRAIGLTKGPVPFDKEQNYIDGYEDCSTAIHAFLTKHQEEISKDAYEMLVTDAVYELYLSNLNGIKYYYNRVKAELSPEQLKRITDSYFRNIEDSVRHVHVSLPILTRSYYYSRYLVRKNTLDAYFKHKINNPDNVFESIFSNYTGELRERMLTLLLYNAFGSTEYNNHLAQVQKIAKTEYCISALHHLEKRKTGKIAADFKLENVSGNLISLSDYKNKVVVIDFWFTGCAACSWVFENVLLPVKGLLNENSEVVFISVSIDKSKQKWLESISAKKYTLESNVNLYTNGKGSLHTIISDYGVKSYPTLVIINSDGIIESNNFHEFNTNSMALYDKIVQVLQTNSRKNI